MKLNKDAFSVPVGSSDEILIAHEGLRSSVAASKENVAKEILQGKKIKIELSNISIDSSGRVIIKNKDFFDMIQSAVIKGDINICCDCFCGWWC